MEGGGVVSEGGSGERVGGEGEEGGWWRGRGGGGEGEDGKEEEFCHGEGVGAVLAGEGEGRWRLMIDWDASLWIRYPGVFGFSLVFAVRSSGFGNDSVCAYSTR